MLTNNSKTAQDTYYKCLKCGDEIYWNTHKNLTYCKCSAIVDGCDDYVRLIGNKEDREMITK